MKIFSIGKKLIEKDNSLSDNNILVSLTYEEWAGESFRLLPHHKKVGEHVSRSSGVHVRLFEKCVLGSLLVLQKSNHNADACPLSFYITENEFYFIGSQNVIEKLIHRANKNSLPDDTDARDLLCVFINLLIDEDNVFLSGVETALKKMEGFALEASGDAFLLRLSSFRKVLRAYKTLYVQLSSMILSIQSNPHKMFTSDQCSEYYHLGVRSDFVLEQIKDLSEYSLQIKEIYQSQVSMKQTRAMNILTVVSSIFLPLTLMTGWYGMNFRFMPELNWSYSYLAVFAVSVIIVVVEIVIFWKKGLFK